MGAPSVILELVERFARQWDACQSSAYNEAQLRQEFLNPFFKALGWDMDNTQGYAAAYKDVIHEDAIRIGSAVKAPDYSFRIGGTRKFFLEAKKPAVNIRDDPTAAYQLRRYAWSAKLPLSLLSNFDVFAVYDGRFKPVKTDPAATARIFCCTFRDYAEHWDWMAARFSREAVLKGAFDDFAEASKGKRGTTEVDVAFLAEIEAWRADLARTLALRNARLTQRELNFAVQRIIDRIIFLRICEDRGIEDYGRLLALTNGDRIYPRLARLFADADVRYNSGLFHFKPEPGRHEAPDELTLDLELDDRLLRDMLRGLYYPDSPYEFSVLSADILGQVYEQFLGKVIRLTEGHQAKVDEKPEVKKAGGVYYTPTYIVDYIVRQTVGERVAGQTPRQVSKLRILDPACGSGSFLIGAYQYLLDWHLDWYVAHDPVQWAKGSRPAVFQARGGWRLTTAERKRILLNNIYGVDIDAQAVEVTKLSLLLKVLEGETGQSLQTLFSSFHERALPDLGDNIKCGNSLIGPDFYRQGELPLLTDDEKYRINVFDWPTEFASVFTAGGFDVVIGNPPYVRIQTMQVTQPQEVGYFSRAYRAANQGNYDFYVVFVERGLQLLAKHGRLGFILPHKFFNAQYGAGLRGIIAAGRHLAHVVHFGAQQVFDGATTYTCLMFLDRAGAEACEMVQVADLKRWQKESLGSATGDPAGTSTGQAREAAAVHRVKRQKITQAGCEGRVLSRSITAAEWNFVFGADAAIIEMLSERFDKLVDITDRMAQGIRTSANEVYVLDIVRESGNTITAHSAALDREVKLECKSVTRFLQGREIKPYRILPSRKIVIIPYVLQNGRAVLFPETDLRTRFPLLYDYLIENKILLSAREKNRMRGSDWYAYIYPKNIDIMQKPKILVPDIADRASFAMDEDGTYAFTSGYGITLRPDVKESPKYILALLNSSLLDLYLKRISTMLRGGYFRYFAQFIGQLPIRRIDFALAADKSHHDRMVQFVEQMLALRRQLAATRTPQEKIVLERQIAATDAQIDRLVYDLYALSEDEIRIVEDAAKAQVP